MSAALVTLTLRLERHDHSRELTAEDALSIAGSELDGADWWDDDYKYEVSVIRAEVTDNRA